jgi:integrase
MRRLLTDRFCSTAKARDGEVQTDYFDTQVSGLALRVSESRKSWTLHYTLAGSRKRLTFGTYPALSLAGARTRADEAKAGIAVGAAPGLAATETFRDICERYQSREGSKLRTAGWRKAALERHVYPTLGPRPIGEIRRSEIVRLLDRIEEGSGSAMATQTLALIRTVMNWHATRSDDFVSPVVRGMARTNHTELSRSRVLNDDELRAIWAADAGVFGRFIRFLLLTAARRNEVAGMSWAELVGGDWILPAARNKTGVELVRPLSRAAQTILERLPKAGQFVWGNGKAFTNFSNSKEAFDKACGVKGWRLHDLRRTARSLMSRAGVPTDHAERCLGHVIGGVRGVYDRHEYRDEKLRAFEALAGMVERITSGGGDVVQLKGRGTR